MVTRCLFYLGEVKGVMLSDKDRFISQAIVDEVVDHLEPRVEPAAIATRLTPSD